MIKGFAWVAGFTVSILFDCFDFTPALRLAQDV